MVQGRQMSKYGKDTFPHFDITAVVSIEKCLNLPFLWWFKQVTGTDDKITKKGKKPIIRYSIVHELPGYTI